MDMRDQKFGIEIEMTGITRKMAAGVIAAYFSKQAQHVGGAYDEYMVRDLLVEREDMELDRIRNTVHTVNGMFPAEEYLSDEIYRYDRESGTLSIIAASVPEEYAEMVQQ